jgi:hypothetical protein
MTAVVRRGNGIQRSGRLPKEVVQRLEQIHQDGMTQAAHVAAAAQVTKLALHLTSALTVEEGLLVAQNPLGEVRYALLVNSFTAGAAFRIGEMGL